MIGSVRIRFMFQKAFGFLSIHVQTIIPLQEHVFQEQLAKHLCQNQKSSVFQCIRFPEHPCQATIRFPRAFGYQNIHAQAMISFVFQEHRVTRASMPSHDLVYVSKSIRLPFRSCSKSIQLPERPCPDHNSVVFREHSLTRASMSKP